MKLEVVNPASLGEAKGYANGVLVPPGASVLYVAGQVGWDAAHRFPDAVGPDGFLQQFERALANVVEVVRAAGGEPASLTRLTIFVTDKTLYEARLREVGRVWRERIGRWYPAMTLVEVKSLLEPRALVELEATAAFVPSSVSSPAPWTQAKPTTGGAP